MSREPLPTRRETTSHDFEWQGHPIRIQVGHYEDGRMGEVFCDTARGGHMQATLADACVLISIGLQRGVTIAEQSKSVARVPAWPGNATTAASPIGAILDALSEAQA